ncbi:MAG TPA: discoidin domain-containing protein, partial [Candidatus Baltobacteraceae bacterium]
MGIASAVSASGGNGFYVGWTDIGDWYRYTVNVQTAATYNLAISVDSGAASGSTAGTFHIEDQSGNNLTGEIHVSGTGSWNANWVTVNATMPLSAGVNFLKVVIDSGAGTFNLNYMILSAGASSSPTQAPTQAGGGSSPSSLLTGASATASSNQSGFPASNVNDGNASSYWESLDSAGLPQSITLNFGAIRSMGSVTLALPPATSWSTRTQTFSVAGSTNGSSYSTLVGSANYTFNPASGNTVSFSLPAGTSEQYLQLVFSANTGWTAAQLAEFDVYSGSGSGSQPTQSPTQAPTQTPSGGSSESTYPNGSPWAIPGTIDFDNYNTGGQGVGYNTGSTTNQGGAYRQDGVGIGASTNAGSGNGFFVGWNAAGDWYRYTVNVPATATYNVAISVASASTSGVARTFHLEDQNGNNLTGEVQIPLTGNWTSSWTIVNATVQLNAGTNVLKAVTDGGSYNLNDMTFTTGGASSTPPPVPTQAPTTVPTHASGSAPSFVYSPFEYTGDFAGPTITTQVTGGSQSVLSVMPSGVTAMTWAFASGTCGSENWNGTSPSSLVSANVQAWVNAGKQYIISTGGGGGAFTCPTTSGFLSFVRTYYSSSMIGVDFDIENGQSQAVINALVQDCVAATATYPNLRWSFTIASGAQTTGGDPVAGEGDKVLQAIAQYGLKNYTVDLMAMDYTGGPGQASPGVCVVVNNLCEMGQSAVQAAKDLHSADGIPYANIELTLLVGGNDV